MTVSDNTIKAEGLSSFFKKLVKISAEAGKKTSNQCTQKSSLFSRNWYQRANVATAAASRNPKAALSTLSEVINFYHTGKRLHLGKIV